LSKKIERGRVYLSYIAEISIKMFSIKAKSMKFGHPNKLTLTMSPAPGVRHFEENPKGLGHLFAYLRCLPLV
jgi:hypothetical protein